MNGGIYMNIAEIDKNFKVETKLPFDDIVFYNAESSPFRIHGIFKENGLFRRIPEEVANRVNEGVVRLHTNTAGGRVRFVTDSKYVAIQVKMPYVVRLPHNPMTSTSGFDIYVKKDGVDTYYKTFVPPFDMKMGYESSVTFPSAEKREITIHFPLYNDVSSLHIGLQKTANVWPATDYDYDLPIVYYGSSITQGGCASRPGNSYQAMLSCWLNVDHVNLGFSGSGKAEDAMAEYVKNLKMSIFVYDYDHNAPTLEHLEATHEKMFRTVREAQPDLPIVMMSRPKYELLLIEGKRLDVIRRTYQNALDAGDRNVYLVEGRTLMAIAENNGTVDDCHPNDLGFFSMAKALEGVLKNILKK